MIHHPLQEPEAGLGELMPKRKRSPATTASHKQSERPSAGEDLDQQLREMALDILKARKPGQTC